MALDYEKIGEDYEEGQVVHGGGGGGRKKEFGSEKGREKKKGEEVKLASREANQERQAALRDISERIREIAKKDKSREHESLKAYFEWVRLGLLACNEIKAMKAGCFGDEDLAKDMIMREADLKEEFLRSQGAGGQNVNKVSSAVRLEHEPSGIRVKVQESRDQVQNRPIARERLLSALVGHLSGWCLLVSGEDEKEVMSRLLSENGGRGTEEMALRLKEGRNL